MKCDRCNYDNLDDAKYCVNCGKKLPKKTFEEIKIPIKKKEPQADNTQNPSNTEDLIKKTNKKKQLEEELKQEQLKQEQLKEQDELDEQERLKEQIRILQEQLEEQKQAQAREQVQEEETREELNEDYSDQIRNHRDHDFYQVEYMGDDDTDNRMPFNSREFFNVNDNSNEQSNNNLNDQFNDYNNQRDSFNNYDYKNDPSNNNNNQKDSFNLNIYDYHNGPSDNKNKQKDSFNNNNPFNISNNQKQNSQYNSEKKDTKRQKSTFLAVLLSLIVAGFGHFYLGKYMRGAVFLVLSLILSFLSSTYEIAFYIGIAVLVYQACDVYFLAQELKNE